MRETDKELAGRIQRLRDEIQQKKQELDKACRKRDGRRSGSPPASGWLPAARRDDVASAAGRAGDP
jgi:phage-related tail protein